MKIVNICIAALVAVVTAAGTAPSVAQDKPLTKVVFSLDFVPSGRHAPWYAAIAEGYFKNEGLDVTIIPGQGGGNSKSWVHGPSCGRIGACQRRQGQNGICALPEDTHCGFQLESWR